mmetsp:Transcript_6559/g.9093  ORF Transcript_6559/g.9093 Transcript_6559/m.9093 type:complete len:257 (-) Transcript_6559:551-1321(-)
MAPPSPSSSSSSSLSNLNELSNIYQLVHIDDKDTLDEGLLATTVEGGVLTIKVTNVQDTWGGEFDIHDLRKHIEGAGLKNIPVKEMIRRIMRSLSKPGGLELHVEKASVPQNRDRGTTLLFINYNVDGIPLQGRFKLVRMKLADESGTESQAKAVMDIIRDLVNSLNKGVSASTKPGLTSSYEQKIIALEEKLKTLQNELDVERTLRTECIMESSSSMGATMKEKKARKPKLQNRNIVNPLIRRRKRQKVQVGRRR